MKKTVTKMQNKLSKKLYKFFFNRVNNELVEAQRLQQRVKIPIFLNGKQIGCIKFGEFSENGK